MSKKIAINGFGRIGRNAFKLLFERPDLEVVAINDLTDTKTLAYLLAHDSSYGNYHHKVTYTDDSLVVAGKKIKILAEKDPAALPWKELEIDVVVESTGLFTEVEKARAHITAGAKKVVISAPSKGENSKMVVLGVNENILTQDDEIISNASCTTNSVAPVMAILDREFGVEKSMLTTVHSYTASQRILDAPARDLREARAAAENIVPSTTGAAIATGKVIPSLAGKFDGISIRVPTPVVSLSDITAVLKRDTTKEELNEVFRRAAAEPFYQGILTVSEEPLVSSDFKGNSHSSIIDAQMTNVVGGNLVKVVAWYDNEWGYSNRLVELVSDVAANI